MAIVMLVLRIVGIGLMMIVLDYLFVRLTWPPVSRFWDKAYLSIWSFRLSMSRRTGSKDIPLKWLNIFVRVMFLQVSPLVLIGLGGWIAWEVLQLFVTAIRVFVGW
jgi:hypothetical protein